MNPGIAAFEVVACGLRPEGSLAHMAALSAFVWLAWRLSRRERARR